MATINITDSSSAIANATVLDESVVGKTPASVIRFLRSDVIDALNQPLNQVQLDSLALGFSYLPSFPLAGGSATFTAGGILTGEIDLYQPAGSGKPSPLFASDQFGSDIEMGSNCYAALSFQLSPSFTPGGTPGAFTLSLASSASATAKLYLPFEPDATGAYPTLKTSLETLLSSYKLPSTVSDFTGWLDGSVFTFDCQGSVSFAGEFDFLAAVNPTATPGFSSSACPIQISAGPSVSVGGSFTLSGEFQVRVWKQEAGVLQLGYYKKHGTSFSVSFDAGADANAALGKFDIIAKIYGVLGDTGQLDPAWLKTNVPGAVADDVSAAYSTAVQTKLSIEVDAECDTSLTDQAAFSWKFDMRVADGSAQAAFLAALRGDLSQLLSGSPLPAGVTKVGSVLDRISDAKHVFTFNFLGLFDHASVQEAVLDMSTKVSADGQLIITDEAHLTRLSADATPFVKGASLQKVFAEDCTATVGYAAAYGDLAPELHVKYSYYEYLRNAQASDLSIFLATATQLLSSDIETDWTQVAQAKSASQSASFLASLDYDCSTAKALFLNSAGTPRAVSDYETVGRQALLLTPGLGLNPALVAVLSDDAKWQAVRDAGAANNVYPLLGADTTDPPQWAVVSSAWITHVTFWAPKMHSAGQALQAIAQYRQQHPNINPLDDADFRDRRQTFASQLKNAIQGAPMFNDALGIFSMVQAAKPVSKSVTIAYGGKSKTY
jgi:hypothetical protein